MTFQREISTHYRITKYPAIKFFKKEFPYTYDGGKNSHQIKNWIKRRIRGIALPTLEVSSPEELGEEIKIRNKGGVVVFYGNISSKGYRDFAKAGKMYTDNNIIFCHTENDWTIEAYEIKLPTPTPKEGVIV